MKRKVEDIEIDQSGPEEKSRCFFNAMRVWDEIESVLYIEGYARSQNNINNATFHAWNMVEGEIIDVTANSFDQYRGVTFPEDQIRKSYENAILGDEWGVIPREKDGRVY